MSETTPRYEMQDSVFELTVKECILDIPQLFFSFRFGTVESGPAAPGIVLKCLIETSWVLNRYPALFR